MFEYYPTLIEAGVEFRIESRKLLGEYKSREINLNITIYILHVDQPYQLDPAHETLPIAKGFKIVKDPKNGDYLVLQGNQTCIYF